MSIPGRPGAPFPPAPPPRKSHTVRIVLIVVGAVLVVCCAGGIVGGVSLFRGVARATGPALKVADEFVTDLQSGDTSGAYDLLCDSTRGAFTPEAFARGVTSQPRIVSHRTGRVNVTSGTGGSTAVVAMKLTMQNGFVDEHTFPLVKEDSRWKVCGGPY
jgi:hypothetical protein